MRNKLHILLPVLLAFLLVAPVFALGFGSLHDMRYKMKPADGNRWAHLVGQKRVVRGDEATDKIAFTFDDGPFHRTTPIILNQLDRYNIKAAFFVNGHRFHEDSAGGMENRKVLREMHRRGHYIGNHTFSHLDISDLTDDGQWKREISMVERQVEELTGTRPYLFRPPFGSMGTEQVERLKSDAYTPVLWNLDPLDWNCKSARQLVERSKKIILDNPGGGVFLMHDTNQHTVEALPLILEWIEERNMRLRAEGKPILEIVSIDQFIESR